MGKGVLAMMLFLLAVAVVNAANNDTCGVVFSDNVVAIFLLGLVISLLAVSVWYMFGKIVYEPEVEATTKVELQQIGITMLIAVMLGGALGVVCNVRVSAEGAEISEGGIFAQADETYQNLTKRILEIYLDMSNAIMERALLGSVFGGTSIMHVTVSMSPYSANSLIANTIAPVAQSMLIAYFAAVFQYSLLRLFMSDAFLMLIPIGLCLRAFPITRKFGGTLLATAIGLSIIFPLIVSFTYSIVSVNSIDYKTISIGNEVYGYIIPFASAMLAVMLAGALAGMATLSGVIISGVAGLLGLTALGLSSGMDTASINEHFIQVYNAYGSIMLLVFFIPALQVLITAALVRSLAGTLGSEIDISGIMRAI